MFKEQPKWNSEFNKEIIRKWPGELLLCWGAPPHFFSISLIEFNKESIRKWSRELLLAFFNFLNRIQKGINEKMCS